MSSNCSVKTCSNFAKKTKAREKNGDSSVSNGYVSYHCFPKDAKLAELWLEKCQRSAPVNIKSATVCSEHFDKDDFIEDMQNRVLGLPMRRFLKKNAVPCLKLPSLNDNDEVESVGAMDEKSSEQLGQEVDTETQTVATTPTEKVCQSCELFRATSAMLNGMNSALYDQVDKLKNEKAKLENEKMKWKKQKIELLEDNLQIKNSTEELLFENRELKKRSKKGKTNGGKNNKKVLPPSIKTEVMDFFEDKDYVLPFPENE